MNKLRYPFPILVVVSAAVAAVLLLFGLGRQRLLRNAARAGGKVAIVEVSGLLTSSHDVLDRTMSARRIVEQLEKYGDDDAVKAVVLRVNSPGGTVVAAQEIFGAIKRLRSENNKKVVVSMADLAASGGYYIACAGDRVFANPGTLTGSIGVIMQFPNVQGLLGKIGVSTNTVKSGEFKDIGNSFREMTDRDRRLLQALVDDVYLQFVRAVSEGRGIPADQVRKLADGRIYSGKQAKELGLVDELGDLAAAITAAARLAGIEGKPQIVREKTKNKLWDLIDSRVSSLWPLSPLLSAEYGQARLLYLWQ